MTALRVVIQHNTCDIVSAKLRASTSIVSRFVRDCAHRNFEHPAQFDRGNHEWLFSSFSQLFWNAKAQETLTVGTRGEAP
jgi:hypothetical protein